MRSKRENSRIKREEEEEGRVKEENKHESTVRRMTEGVEGGGSFDLAGGQRKQIVCPQRGRDWSDTKRATVLRPFPPFYFFI